MAASCPQQVQRELRAGRILSGLERSDRDNSHLRVPRVILTILCMRTSRVAGLVFLATATLAQQQQSVEITSEPSHHLVFQNEYVRVFDVTVAPRATTLVHKHNHDYLFVTLGDSDVVSARPGEKPVSLQLKDGEVRYTPGNFAHAAINKSDRPFHNITIELLKPSTGVTECMVDCHGGAVIGEDVPSVLRLYSSDQWTARMFFLPSASHLEKLTHTMPYLMIPVSDLDLTEEIDSSSRSIKQASGDIGWVPAGVTHTLTNHGSKPAQFITLEFKPEKQNQ
jgi:quercetin dioxygenase-like cupin family protein